MGEQKHITKDSGKRNQWSTGAQRDTEDGKPLFHQIPFKVLDEMQQKAGGSPIKIDRSERPIFHAAPEQRHDLIPQLPLDRLAALYYRGALKYDDNNWQKGIPLVRVFGSMLRHAYLWFWGDTSEDHLAAVIWNAITLMWTEAKIHEGGLPSELDDRMFAKTRIIYSWEGHPKRMMDLDGWLDDATAEEQCQAFWSIPITVYKVHHWLDKKK